MLRVVNWIARVLALLDAQAVRKTAEQRKCTLTKNAVLYRNAIQPKDFVCKTMKTPNSIVLFVLIVATTVVRHATARRQGGLRSLKATMADGDKSVYGLLVRAAPKRRTLQVGERV